MVCSSTLRPHGIEGLKFRALGVDLPGPESPELRLSVREDTAHLLVTEYGVPADSPTELQTWERQPCHDVLRVRAHLRQEPVVQAPPPDPARPGARPCPTGSRSGGSVPPTASGSPPRARCSGFLDLFIGKDRSSAPNIEFTISRYPLPAWLTAAKAIEEDSNPLAVFGGIWGHPRFGLGLSSDRLDTVLLNQTATTLVTEGVGLSGVITSGTRFDAFLADLFRHCDAYLVSSENPRS